MENESHDRHVYKSKESKMKFEIIDGYSTISTTNDAHGIDLYMDGDGQTDKGSSNNAYDDIDHCLDGDGQTENDSPTDASVLNRATVDAIRDLPDAIGFSIDHDISIDNLETVDECKERFYLHLEKVSDQSNRKYTIEKSMLNAGQDDANRRQKLKSVMKEMLQILHTEAPQMAGKRLSRGSEFVEGLLRMEGTSQNLENDCKEHMAAMENEECLVIVAGETSAGKSSVLNLLFEDDILPVHNNSSTSTITTVRYHTRKHVRIMYKREGDPDLSQVFDLDEEGLEKLQAIAFMKSASERENHNIKEVQVFLPLPILQALPGFLPVLTSAHCKGLTAFPHETASGLVLVDTPGIGENEYLETELINFISKNQIRGFIYIIKTDNAGGVQEDRLLSLLKIVIEKQRSGTQEDRARFDPKSALFVCNRIDLIKRDEVGKVKQNAIDKLSGCWPGLEESQVVFFSTERAKRDVEADRDYINDSYKHLLNALKDLFISAMEKRIKVSYKWLETVLKRTVHHLKSVVSRLDLTDMELKTKSESIRSKLEGLRLKSDSVLAEVRVTVEGESAELCRFLKQQLVSNQYREKLTKNWSLDQLPKVDSGLGNWSWIKIRIQEAFLDRLMELVDNLERDEERVDRIEQDISFRIKFELKLLEEELSEIEKEIQGDNSSNSSDGISDLAKSRRKSVVSLSPTRSKYMLAEPTLPLKVAGRLVRPFKVAFEPIKNRLRINEYKNNPLKVAEECARTLYTDMCRQADMKDSGLAQLADILLERPRELINAIQQKIPDMIFANQLMLNTTEESIETERQYQTEYEEMMTCTESLKRSLMEYGEGYIFVNGFSRGELQIMQPHPDTGDTMSVAFNVTDFLRGSSGDLDTTRMRDIRGLWTVTYGGQLMRNGLERSVAIRVYLPSSGVECTFKEVAKLRCLTCRGTGIAEFLGIHNAQAPTPAFVYDGSLRSVRRFMNSFCNLRKQIPDILEGTACGLEYLHNKGLVHMELTQDTVTVDEYGTVQLSGACLPREPTLPTYKESIETGSFVYLAPEILGGEMYEGTADIYSFGLLIIELMVIQMPVVFKRQRRITLYDFAQTVNPEEMLNLEQIVEIFTIKTRALIENCLQLDKNNRPFMSSVVEYTSYIKNEKEALEKLPARRTRRMPVQKRCSKRESTHF